MFMKEWRGRLYWLATGAVALLFAVPGSALLIGVPHFTVEMARLGYPSYFLVLFGLLKIIGALTILAPLPLLMAVALMALEFLVAALQAYVFTVLTCIYLNDALHPGH